eukprot:GHVL01006685.1.p1 GENE.GHVL01006685.1~~GHVL01006685.1.p1  ORF type:complete len:461 (+),score=97.93 GHVL01006685.1:70-1452(+)
MSVITEYEPKRVWELFEDLSKIPRQSHQEEKVIAWLKDFAKTNNLTCKQDSYGNLSIFKPSAVGHPIILQCHVDMVTEKNDSVKHDFSKDPLALEISNDGWLNAKGTTLGADNGIGCCIMMRLLEEKNSLTPPLECLFTVEEEIGLVGAKQFNPTELGLTGGSMINLDTEEWGIMYIGCAGGTRNDVRFPIKTEPFQNGHVELCISLGGFMGGHSGANIHEDRGNPIKIASRILDKILLLKNIYIIDMKGGDKFNALCREINILLSIQPHCVSDVEKILKDMNKTLEVEYRRKEHDFYLKTEPLSTSIFKNEKYTSCMTEATSRSLVSLLILHPHGPEKYSHNVDNLVETSINLASVQIDKKGDFLIQSSSRSSVEDALAFVNRKLEILAEQFGAKASNFDKYPGWSPDPNSKLLEKAKVVYKKKFGVTPEVTAIHAGLECGILLDKLPDINTYIPTLRT